MGMLGVASFLILIVIIGMRMATRKGEIEILNLIGATPGFIRSPIVIEALIYCFAGVLLGFLLAFLFWLFVTPNLIAYFGEISILPKGTLDFVILFVAILVGELAIGSLLALFGSMLAVSRARRTR